MAAHAFVIREERDTEVEYRGGPGGQQPGAGLRRDIAEPRRDVGSAGKDNRVDPGADRRHCRPGILAAIQNRAEPCRRNCFPRRAQHFPEPAGTGVNTGVRGAREDDRPPRFGRRVQSRDGVPQRMDGDDRRGFRTAGVTPASRTRPEWIDTWGPRSSQAIAPK